MKEIILTIDYELFFGEKVGSVDSCMITPTELLADLLAKYDSRMTVFWDILHYWKLRELSNNYAILTEDAQKIREQILKLAEANHDIQLHLHPHWINTTFNGQDWQFNLDGYRLHDLSQENNPQDINSIAGCVKIGKNLIEETIKSVNPYHKVNTFRAGGYCIQPFDKLANVFSTNGILYDSSVCFGIKLTNRDHSYDFTSIPLREYYKFESDIKKEEPEGKFLEFPISSINVSPFQILFWAFLHRLKYKNLRPFGEIGLYEKHKERKSEKLSDFSKVFRKGLNIFFKRNYVMFTPDNFFREKLNYLVKHTNTGSVMILHPKYLNYHTLGLIEDYLKNGYVRFISIHEKISGRRD